jgi:23S rRNA-/tRNA-specific pseudouridylate synthase
MLDILYEDEALIFINKPPDGGVGRTMEDHPE